MATESTGLLPPPVSGVAYSEPPLRVLFCGNHFQKAFECTREEIARCGLHIQLVQCELQDVVTEIRNADVVIPLMAKLTGEVLDQATKLRLVMQYGVGLEGVHVAHASQLGIAVCNIHSEDCRNAASCAEHAIFLALACLRNINALQESKLSSRLGYPAGRMLAGKRAVIYGLGGIGKRLAMLLRAFDVKTVAVIRRPLPEEGPDSSSSLCGAFGLESIVMPADLHLVGGQTDLLFLCCNQHADNIGMVDSHFISQLKPGVTIINVARGGLLNYSDVYAALNDGTIAAAGLDVFHTEPFPHPDSEAFLRHPRVFTTPHVAGVTEECYQDMAALVVHNMQRLLNCEPLKGVVNGIDIPEAK